MKKGDSFGEMGLIKKQPRNETVQCLTRCYFATLDYVDFEKQLKKINSKLESEKLDFFKNLTFFKHYTIV